MSKLRPEEETVSTPEEGPWAEYKAWYAYCDNCKARISQESGFDELTVWGGYGRFTDWIIHDFDHESWNGSPYAGEAEDHLKMLLDRRYHTMVRFCQECMTRLWAEFPGFKRLGYETEDGSWRFPCCDPEDPE